MRLTRANGKSNPSIALIMPPTPYLTNDLVSPPMGLLYIAGSIREELKYDPQIIELGGNINWRDEARKIDADVIGIHCATSHHTIVEELVKLLDPSSFKVIGGVHPTFVPSVIKELGFDTGIIGMGERAFLSLLKDIKNGTVKEQYFEECVDNIDDIPMPALDLVDLNTYTPGGKVHIAPLHSSRGCVNRCTYCSKISGRKYQAHSPERVIQEIEHIRNAFGINQFVFTDDNVGIYPSRLKKIIEMIQPLDIAFRLNISAGYIKQEIVELAKSAGCFNISFGVESFSEKMLKRMRKPATRDKNAECIRITKDNGITSKIYLMVNYPGETEETVDETIEWFHKVKPDDYLLSQFTPLPGSNTWSNPKKFGITSLSPNWEDYYLFGEDWSFRPCFTTEYLTYDKQIELHKRLYNGLKEGARSA